ncbi:hypothetical protein GVAV_003175 [Gurleya vavrai]
MKIISKKQLKLKNLKYYKFPLYSNIINDNTKWFKTWYFEWKQAFISVFKNFTEKNEKFYLQFNKKTLIFENKIIKADFEFKDFFIKNEIIFEDEQNFLIVIENDVAMVFDLIMNNEIKNKDIPFILSFSEFENGCVSFVKVKQKSSFLNKKIMNFCYFVDGYFYGDDYKDFFDNEIIFNIDK